MKTVSYSQPGGPLQGFATVPATSDAREYLKLLLRHKWGLLLASVLGLAIAALYLISTAPTYEASALVEVRDEGNIFDRGTPQPVNFNAPTIKEESNILQSRRVLQPVIDRFDLRTHAEAARVPVLGDLSERLPWLANWLRGIEAARPYAWSDESIDVLELEVPQSWEDRDLTLTVLDDGLYRVSYDDMVLLDEARTGQRQSLSFPGGQNGAITVQSLSEQTGVQFNVSRGSLERTLSSLHDDLSTDTTDSKSRMISIRVRGDHPDKVADITNAIVEQYREVKRGSETRESSAELAVYEESLPKVQQELREAEAALSAYRTEANSIDQDTQTRAQLDQLATLEKERIELQLEKEELQSRYTEAYPSFRKLNNEIDVIEKKIGLLRREAASAPNVERELTVLMQQEETARKVFNEMNERLQKLRVAEAGNVGNVQVWDEALPPKKPVAPSRLLALVASVLGTLFLYLLWLTLRSALSTVISDQESLERASGLPVLINIPQSSAQRRLEPRKLLPGGAPVTAGTNVLALSRPEDYSVENLRGLRSMLDDVMGNAINNVLMITSPLPGMGKSFVSMNLAVLLAQAGKRVLLLDADYQRGQLHKVLGLPIGPGLPEVVRGKSELKESVRHTGVQNLYCVTRGFLGGSTLDEMPTDREFGIFMKVVAPRFDVVIMDTPPVLSVAAASSFGKQAGSTLMVIKERLVNESQLTESLKRLNLSGVRVSGCILNGSSGSAPRHYTYYREQLD